MAVIGFIAPWVLVGIAVIVFAVRGSSSPARGRRRRPSGRGLAAVFVPVGIVLAVLVPAAVIADNGPERSSSATAALTAEEERGRDLFTQTCASCHSLAAANARGVTGPNLDALGAIDQRRVEIAIEVGGSGEKRMPAGLLEGENAAAVGAYVAKVAGG